MIGKDHSYPPGRYISQESNGELDDGYVRNVAHVAAVIKSGGRFSSGCCRGFFLGLLFRRRLAGLVCLFLFLCFFFILEIQLSSFTFFRKYFKTNCFISMCRTEFGTASNQFYWHRLEKNVDESSRMWKDWNFKVLNTERRKISEVVSLSDAIYCVGIC